MKAINEDFNFRSLRQTLEILDCSKFWLYKLLSKGIIKAYYLDKDDKGNPTGKPYFNLNEIRENFCDQERTNTG